MAKTNYASTIPIVKTYFLAKTLPIPLIRQIINATPAAVSQSNRTKKLDIRNYKFSYLTNDLYIAPTISFVFANILFLIDIFFINYKKYFLLTFKYLPP